MPALLLPAGLAALAALALPLLVHLARRTEQRPTDFAALRWLTSRPKPRHRPRFDEWPLLILRLLLLALLALTMAQPVLLGAPTRTPWVAVAPGVDPVHAAALVKAGARGVWLAPGFPPLAEAPPSGPVPVGSLVRQLDAELPSGARLTLLVPAVIETADAERPRVSRPVDWRVVPGRMAARARSTSPAPNLAIRYAANPIGLQYLRAAASALVPAGATLDIAPATAPLPRAMALAWLAPGALPASVTAWAARGGMVLLPADGTLPPGPVTVVWRDELGAPLVEQIGLGHGRVIRFTQPLTPAAMPALVNPDFPTRLARLLDVPPSLPARIAAVDDAPVLGARQTSAADTRADLIPWLGVLMAILVVGERWLATGRRRSLSP